MAIDKPEEKRGPEEHPRVRWGIWLLVLLVLGSGLLYLGAKQAWFVRELEAGSLANQGLLLRWAMIGVAYSILATWIFARQAPKVRKRHTLIAFLTILGFMLGGGRVVTRLAMNQTFIPIATAR